MNNISSHLYRDKEERAEAAAGRARRAGKLGVPRTRARPRRLPFSGDLRARSRTS